MVRITGGQNPLVKEIRALKNKSGREETGLFFIEGVRFVTEALQEKASIRYLMVSETFSTDAASMELLQSVNDGADCYRVPDSLFASISDTQTPQGILAVLDLKRRQLENAVLSGGLLVLLDGIKDPGNMGTIIRTADAAGCEGIVVPAGCVDIYNPKVLRSTMGSVFHVPVYHCEDMKSAINIARRNGYKIRVSHLDGAVSIYEADLTGPAALVIGSEAEGVGDEIVKAADMLLKIPMPGRAESLNASVAAGIMIFETTRQKYLKEAR